MPAQHAQRFALRAQGQHCQAAGYGKNQQDYAKTACQFNPKRHVHSVLHYADKS